VHFSIAAYVISGDHIETEYLTDMEEQCATATDQKYFANAEGISLQPDLVQTGNAGQDLTPSADEARDWIHFTSEARTLLCSASNGQLARTSRSSSRLAASVK
jgi:hypothetical protein